LKAALIAVERLEETQKYEHKVKDVTYALRGMNSD
jgi:hypothetical protein